MPELAITPRNLGSLRLKHYCPRCLFYLLRMRFHPPFASFGAGIFNALQRVQEAIVGHHLDKTGGLPREFPHFCDCCSRIEFPKHWSKFRYTHESGVILYGQPDEIFQLKNGSLCVIDHKTAKNKGVDDPFHGQYETQVVGYSNIAEVGLELGTVSEGGLFYWEVQTESVEADPAAHYEKPAVCVEFIPKPLEVTIDYAMLDPLIKEVQDIWNTREAPGGRDGCADCKKLHVLLGIQRDLEARDAKWLKDFGDLQEVRNQVIEPGYRRIKAYADALHELETMGDAAFDPNGIPTNWEFFPGSPQDL